MNRSKKIFFYCLMVMLTLAVIEGMAQAAYYIAYGEVNRPPPDPASAAAARGDDVELFGRLDYTRISHPYYGYARPGTQWTMNRVPPRRREDGVMLIGLLGGSMAMFAADAFQSALEAWFQNNGIPLRPVVLELAYSGMKQPQQVMQVANILSLGGEFDIIVNLDGHNELIIAHENYFIEKISPFFPYGWQLQQELTGAQKLLAGRIYTLRQREQRLAVQGRAEPWRRSALYGIVNRYLRKRNAREISALNRKLATVPAEYNLETHGPIWPAESDDGVAPHRDDLTRIALRVWYRGSVLLAGLSRDAGAEYYHFQQPNQYVPDSKPLSDQELEDAYNPGSHRVRIYRDGYPLLLRLGDELRQQGINYHDLTRIFTDNRETLYRDLCCHVNSRGNELLAASMVQHLAPALRHRAALAGVRVGGGGITAGTALDAAVREVSPVHAVNKQYFDVRLTTAGNVRYTRDGCRPVDTAAPFFVRITPADAVDLTPAGAETGYNRAEFRFDRDGGARDAAGRCVVEYELPDYAVADVVTGQYSPETGRVWWRARLTRDWGFAIEITGEGMLRYSRDNCRPVHLAPGFFLHITPADAADLAPGGAEHGYDNFDFLGFSTADGMIDAAGRCTIERELPDYDIASILTGQHIPAVRGRLWESRIDLELP